MSRNKIIFTLRDVATEEVKFRGTASECAAYLGSTEKNFWSGAQRSKKYKKHLIERSEDTNAEAIRKWDAFVTPLRKKFGLEVYKGGQK